jgi:hypothetical protein
MLMAREFLRGSRNPRKFWLYDTFAGMTKPDSRDVDLDGAPASDRYLDRHRGNHNAWCFASLDEVVGNFRQFGLLDDNVVFCKGPVEETLRSAENIPDRIALLRLDTDWYESTKVGLDVLYPRLVRGGVLIIDDYGHWKGARLATDEYFAERPVFLTPVDYTGRYLVKP